MHVSDEHITVDPVEVRVVPGKPQGNQMGNEIIILRDFGPWFSLYLPSRNVYEPSHI